jgi:RimJ/RimL family protein N-acetyltransferase
MFREFSMKDIDEYYKLEKDPLVRKYIPNIHNSTYAECKESLKKYIDKYNDGTDIQTWAVALRENRRLIGITGFRYLDELDKVEIGIKLMPDYWGNGYATETGKALIQYAFKRLGLKEIITMALPENERSMNAMQKIGLDFDGYGYFAGVIVAFFKATKGYSYY